MMMTKSTVALNEPEALLAYNAIAKTFGTVNTVAVSLFKTARNLRYFGWKPRCGLGELKLFKKEPGLFMMLGKFNLT